MRLRLIAAAVAGGMLIASNATCAPEEVKVGLVVPLTGDATPIALPRR